MQVLKIVFRSLLKNLKPKYYFGWWDGWVGGLAAGKSLPRLYLRHREV